MSVHLDAMAGRKTNRFFFGGSISAFHVTADDTVNRVPVGGSWDALGTEALYGFPLAAYRLASAAMASLRTDVRLVDTFEFGLRANGLVHADGVAYGGAAQFMFRVSGFDFIAGVGLGRPDSFSPNAYASFRAFWML